MTRHLRAPLLTCTLLASLGAAPHLDDDSAASNRLDLEAHRARLVALMRQGIETEEPNSGWFRRIERESVFDGSYDWHSCVLAHFAIATEARRSEDGELDRWLLERLSPGALAAEADLLDARDRRRTITYPYDEAWYLMLLAELERHAFEDPDALRAHRLAVEGRLLAWLEESDFPEGVPEVEFCGFYRSWLFVFLLVQLSEPVGEGVAQALARLHSERIEPNRGGIESITESHDWDFLWLPAVLALVDRTSGGAANGYDPGPVATLPETVSVSTVHPLGVVLSRLWPCAWDAGRGDAGAVAALDERLAAFLEREDLLSGDFAACSHWVPQYAWLVLWFGDGCP